MTLKHLLAHECLKIATYTGANALGFNNSGEIKLGANTDLILLDLTSTTLTPLGDLASAIVYSNQSKNVNSVIIDGKLIMHNREILTLDKEEVLYKVNQLASKFRI